MDTLIKALRNFETLMDQSRKALETMARYAPAVRPGTPLDPESWQKISSYAAGRIRELVDGLREIAPDEFAILTAPLSWNPSFFQCPPESRRTRCALRKTPPFF